MRSKLITCPTRFWRYDRGTTLSAPMGAVVLSLGMLSFVNKFVRSIAFNLQAYVIGAA